MRALGPAVAWVAEAGAMGTRCLLTNDSDVPEVVKKIYLATQMDATEDDPAPDQIYQIGTVAAIVQSLKLPDGNIRVLVEGLERARSLKVDNREGYCVAEVEYMPALSVSEAKLNVLAKRLKNHTRNAPNQNLIIS